ncbi:AzlD domain-containing protein [Bermanella sp. R86510]|uniref:AzlD domain-containing protein n=1 Tax=unclassified Bermanella TaxID=2627862 RepID=UPI0037C50052
MMIASIIGMAIIVYFSRYLFLEPKLPLKLNNKAMRFLNYSSPTILTAIWGPIVFVHDEQIDISWHNTYLLAAVLAVILIWKSKNVLLTTVLSMSVFLLINWLS